MTRFALPLLALAVTLGPASAGPIEILSGSAALTVFGRIQDFPFLPVVSFSQQQATNLPTSSPLVVTGSTVMIVPNQGYVITVAAQATVSAALEGGTRFELSGLMDSRYSATGVTSYDPRSSAEIVGALEFRLTGPTAFTLTSVPENVTASGFGVGSYGDYRLTNTGTGAVFFNDQFVTTAMERTLQLGPGTYRFDFSPDSYTNTFITTPPGGSAILRFRATLTATATPEPASLVVVGSVLAVGGWALRRRARTPSGKV
jgi:hypothetical protein